VAIVALSFAPHGNAADWRIRPTLDVRETYTDNVRLAPRGSERSDFISDISPGLSVSADGPRLKFKAKYAFQHLIYANDGKNDSSYHKLDAATNTELVKNLFFFDGTAAINQQNLSLTGPRATDNYAITDNRTTVRTLTASPYLRHAFGNFAKTELRYIHTAVDTDSDTLSSSQSDELRLGINSGPSFRKLAWDFNYNTRRNRLFDSDSIHSSTVSGNLRYLLTPQFFLTATAGYDKYDYIATAGAPGTKGSFYSGGFSWRPTERTSLSASAGERFYGKSYTLESSVRSRAAVWRVSYGENITTSQSEFSVDGTNILSDLLNQLFRTDIPDDVLRQQKVDQILLAMGPQSINYLTNEFFLQKALRASVAITGAKNTVVFTAFDVSREALSAPGSAPALAGAIALTNGNTSQRGLDALWNLRVGPRTNAMFNASISKSTRELSNTEDRLKTIRVSLSRRLHPNLDGVIQLKHAEQTSNAAGTDYRENAISAFLSMKF
jgi:uncharacterized protein (PEP-CTERM system associated)